MARREAPRKRVRLLEALIAGALAAMVVLLGVTAAFAFNYDRVFDTGFAPAHHVRVRQGKLAGWITEGTNQYDHVLTSFFFTSPSLPPNTQFTVRFNGAGAFTVSDSPSGDSMIVNVLPILSATTGTCGTPLMVQGGVKAQNGTQSFVHTYQVLTPGGAWQVIGKKNTNKLALTYTPGAGCAQGTYQFRVRSTLPTDHSQRSDWSPNVEVTVSG